MDSRFRGNDRHKQALLVSPAEAGVHAPRKDWIPSSEGMTDLFVSPAEERHPRMLVSGTGVHTPRKDWIPAYAEYSLRIGLTYLGGCQAKVVIPSKCRSLFFLRWS